ncbi:phosphotyrosine protein phosphatase [Kushneria phosphatilytica]|uniref:protein-tyrosine-phosphatase n=1 Tax=Kushneria phosphatilytica TaxID=657387 RepID=A0A1S1NZ50_9GAMM|nr:phosphotyrosine protein phosphatase [Kushneria phosphatilytica]QEL12782.1 low molecular weight phosphotyrosine protein phosphatase [Kushneria phosphatilytica]
MQVLFVCLGNICRSPTAEGVLREKLKREGLADSITVDSCGVGDYHVGEGPDARAIREARSRDINIEALVARQLQAKDFEKFDYLLAMDESNLAAIRKRQPAASRAHVALLMDFAEGETHDIPDPYFDSEEGFTRVYELIDQACNGLIAHLRRQYHL